MPIFSSACTDFTGFDTGSPYVGSGQSLVVDPTVGWPASAFKLTLSSDPGETGVRADTRSLSTRQFAYDLLIDTAATLGTVGAINHVWNDSYADLFEVCLDAVEGGARYRLCVRNATTYATIFTVPDRLAKGVKVRIGIQVTDKAVVVRLDGRLAARHKTTAYAGLNIGVVSFGAFYGSVVSAGSLWLDNILVDTTAAPTAATTDATKLAAVWGQYRDDRLRADGLPIRNYPDGVSGTYTPWSDSTSETISYFLKHAVQMDDQTTFDRVFAWAYGRMRRGAQGLSAVPNLYSWHWDIETNTAYDQNSAHDADLDIMKALYWANGRWGTGKNPVVNGGFENGSTSWNGSAEFTLSADTIGAVSGQSLKVTKTVTTGFPNFKSGSGLYPVVGGQTYTAQMTVTTLATHTTNTSNGSNYTQLYAIWRDSGGAAISQTHFTRLDLKVQTYDRQMVAGTLTAPVNAVSVNFSIYQYCAGVAYYDNIMLEAGSVATTYTPNIASYLTTANAIATDLLSLVRTNGSLTYLPSDYAQSGDTPFEVNPSYHDPGAMELARLYHTGNETAWGQVIDGTYALLAAGRNFVYPGQSSSAKLPPDWGAFNPTTQTWSAGSRTNPDRYGYEAFRSFFRIKAHWLHYGATAASTLYSAARAFFAAQWSANAQIKAEYRHDGTVAGNYEKSIFTYAAVQALTTGPDAPVGSYDQSVLADAPVAYFPLNSTTPSDASGRGHAITLPNGATTTTLPNGEAALVFDGINQYANVTDADDLSVVTTGRLTVEAWVRPDVLEFPDSEGGPSNNNYVHFIGKGTTYGTGGDIEWMGRMYNLTNTESRPNRISGYHFNPSGGLGAGSYFQDPVTAGEWILVHIVVNMTDTNATYTTGYTRVAKNGTVRDTDKLSDYSIVPTNENGAMRIATSTLASFFKGAIAKVAVYDYELTQPQMAAHYAAFTATPQTASTVAASISTSKLANLYASTVEGHIYQDAPASGDFSYYDQSWLILDELMRQGTYVNYGLALTLITDTIAAPAVVGTPIPTLVIAATPGPIAAPMSAQDPSAILTLSTATDTIAAPATPGTPTASLALTAVTDTVAAPASVGDPVANLSLTTTTGTIASGVTANDPIVSLGIFVTTDTIASNAVATTPTATFALTATPGDIAAPASVNDPVASVSVAVVTETIATSTVVADPSAVPSLETSTDTIAAPASVQDPTVVVGVNPVVPTIAAPVMVADPSASLALTIQTSTIAALLSAGDSTLAGTLSVTTSGIAVAVSVTDPTASLNLDSQPEGIAAPATANDPLWQSSDTLSLVTDTIAAPVGVSDPQVSLTLSTTVPGIAAPVVASDPTASLNVDVLTPVIALTPVVADPTVYLGLTSAAPGIAVTPVLSAPVAALTLGATTLSIPLTATVANPSMNLALLTELESIALMAVLNEPVWTFISDGPILGRPRFTPRSPRSTPRPSRLA